MALVNNGKKRPKIRKVCDKEVCNLNETVENITEVEETTVVESVEEVEIIESVETVEDCQIEEQEEVEELEEIDEVPLEMSEDEMQVALDEEGSLDGTLEEVEELAQMGYDEEVPAVEEPAEVEEVSTVEEPTEVKEVPAVEEPTEVEEVPAVEEPAEVEETPAVEDTVEDEEDAEEVVEEKPKKDEFKLTAPANLGDVLANICTKRARKLIYRPNEVIFSHTTIVLGTDKANDEKIKIKNILDAEIKQGVKLGYLDKFDGLKMSELKEEYENDIVYEYADQEFKRTGILLDGDKVKVYVYDWDLKACHHVGYIDDESANLVKPYLIDREKYSFDINGIIVGGKYKKIIKDEKSGKITVEKGNDGNLGLEIDINIINRKD